MFRFIWSALTASPVVLGASFLVANTTFAAQNSKLEPVFVGVEEPTFTALSPSEISLAQDLANPTLDEPQRSSETATAESSSQDVELVNDDSADPSADDSMGQITNVTQLSDVSPGDWAYEALRSLVERYGCIAGYPDGTFRGNRAMTRYEFAAGLNACLQQLERLMASSTSVLVRREDLEILQRIVQDFQTELATLGTRVDTLEGRVAFLEDHQFSTTTKLTGSADIGLIDAWGDRKAVPSGQEPTED
jgi:BMFP domain-containing protein YqiC